MPRTSPLPQDARRSSATLLDVRSLEEYSVSHLRGAVWVHPPSPSTPVRWWGGGGRSPQRSLHLASPVRSLICRGSLNLPSSYMRLPLALSGYPPSSLLLPPPGGWGGGRSDHDHCQFDQKPNLSGRGGAASTLSFSPFLRIPPSRLGGGGSDPMRSMISLSLVRGSTCWGESDPLLHFHETSFIWRHLDNPPNKHLICVGAHSILLRPPSSLIFPHCLVPPFVRQTRNAHLMSSPRFCPIAPVGMLAIVQSDMQSK